MDTLSQDAVRGLMIAAQGLQQRPPSRAPTTKADVVVDDTLIAEMRSALRACAAWHETPQVIVRAATEPGLAEHLSG
jgi:hypothetical protein